MSTGWRLRPGTVVVEVAPSRSAGNPKRKAPSTCSRSVRRRPSGKDAVPQVAKLLSPKQDGEAKRKRCVRRQDAVTGTVGESREAHLARHGGGQRTCPRCRWYRRGSEWLCSYGKFNRKMGLRNETVVWLAERPQRFGSEWGLGCTIYAWFVNRSAGERDGDPSRSKPQRGKASRCRLGTRFSRFEVRAEYLQAEHIKQHAESSAHRMAVVAWLYPHAALMFRAQKTLEDEQFTPQQCPNQSTG